MAADKLYWNELRRAVMQRTDATEQEATAFLNALIEQIIEALKADQQVRINGLGTFRLQPMQPRKSVNIATGEEMVIDGYNKVAFTPEASVKEMIGNNPTPDDAPKQKAAKKKKDTESEELTPIQKLGQQADEIVDLLADLGQKPNTGSGVSTPTEEEPKAGQPKTKEENSKLEEVPQQEEKPVVEPAPDTSVEKQEEKTAEPTTITEEEKKKEEQEEATEEKAEEEKEEKKEETTVEAKTKRKYHFWRDTLICVICLLIVLVCGYFFGRAALSNWVESLGQNSTSIDTAVVEEQAVQTVHPTPMDTSMSAPAEELIETPVIVEESTPDTEITYSEYLATEQINEGSRLTWLAYRYYGNKVLWVYIYDANKDHLTDPNHIQVGTAIRIPKLTALQQDTTNAQTKRTIECLKTAANANAK